MLEKILDAQDAADVTEWLNPRDGFRVSADTNLQKLIERGEYEYWIFTGKLENQIESVVLVVTKENVVWVEQCKSSAMSHYEIQGYCVPGLYESKEIAVRCGHAYYQALIQLHGQQKKDNLLDFDITDFYRQRLERFEQEQGLT